VKIQSWIFFALYLGLNIQRAKKEKEKKRFNSICAHAKTAENYSAARKYLN